MPDSLILLIEDNPDDAFLVSRVIGRVCSEKIVVATDGEEATVTLLKMADNGSYTRIRLVLLDLKLPKISGIDVLETIRTHERLRDLPVAVLTSSDNDQDQERCRALGILDYVPKPMTTDRLRSLLSVSCQSR